MRAIRAWRYNLILLMVLTVVNPCLLQAQSGTSSALSGDVTDASGAAVSNATVTATDVNTKATRTGATDAAGHFLFSQVNPGTYQITVEAKASRCPNRNLPLVGVGRTVALNFSLRVCNPQPDRRGDGTAGPAQPRQSKYHNDDRSESQSRTCPTPGRT